MSATERAMWRRARAIGLCNGLTVPLREPSSRRYGVLNVMHLGALAEFDDWLRGHRALLGPAAYLAHLAISNGEAAPGESGSLYERERQLPERRRARPFQQTDRPAAKPVPAHR